MRYCIVLLAAAGLIGTAHAQVRIDSNGVRTGNTVIDSSGVHTSTADVDGAGVRTRRSAAGDTVIKTNGRTRTVNCGGGALTIDGNDNQLTATDCRKIDINGNDNDLTARFSAPGRLTVLGNRNHVSWHAPRTVRVSVSNVGTKSTVIRN